MEVDLYVMWREGGFVCFGFLIGVYDHEEHNFLPWSNYWLMLIPLGILSALWPAFIVISLFITHSDRCKDLRRRIGKEG